MVRFVRLYLVSVKCLKNDSFAHLRWVGTTMTCAAAIFNPTFLINCLLHYYIHLPTTSATVTLYRKVGSCMAPSIWTSSYLGVAPRRLRTSWRTETGVFPTEADIFSERELNLIREVTPAKLVYKIAQCRNGIIFLVTLVRPAINFTKIDSENISHRNEIQLSIMLEGHIRLELHIISIENYLYYYSYK